MDSCRKELKFLVDEVTLREIENRIKGFMRFDEHQKNDYYLIRSIYLDGIGDPCMQENEMGIGRREKYRIRSYNCDENTIFAEVKIRYRDTISKQRNKINRDEFDVLISHDMSRIHKLSADKSGEKAVVKFLDKIIGEAYRPRTIVEYKRYAYTYNPGNVRITFDMDVCASNNFDRFFDRNLHGIPVVEDGLQILEIKYDEILPDEVSMALSGLNLERCSCSKYYRCREKLLEFGM